MITNVPNNIAYHTDSYWIVSEAKHIQTEDMLIHTLHAKNLSWHRNKYCWHQHNELHLPTSYENTIVAGHISASDLSSDLLRLLLYDEHPFIPKWRTRCRKMFLSSALTMRGTRTSRNSIVVPTETCFSINALTTIRLDSFPMPVGSLFLPHGHTSIESSGTRRA